MTENRIIFQELKYSESEIKQIVSLIRQNLDSEFTEKLFRWKHLANPFGRSFGLVAVDGVKIIGLRMFMFWEFWDENSKKIIKAIRPVDTVVDKNYQGQGIFKKLTLHGLDLCKGQYDLVFNTPNMNSLPGYIKMGWIKLKTRYFKVGLVLPAFSKGDLHFGNLPKHFSTKIISYSTYKNHSYLQWRFQDNNYKIARHKDAFIIYNMSKAYGFNQIVFQEIFGEKSELQELIGYLANKEKSFLIYYYANDFMDGFLKFKFNRTKSVVVIKDDSLGIGKDLIFSLGDLEGKL